MLKTGNTVRNEMGQEGRTILKGLTTYRLQSMLDFKLVVPNQEQLHNLKTNLGLIMLNVKVDPITDHVSLLVYGRSAFVVSFSTPHRLDIVKGRIINKITKSSFAVMASTISLASNFTISDNNNTDDILVDFGIDVTQ